MMSIFVHLLRKNIFSSSTWACKKVFAVQTHYSSSPYLPRLYRLTSSHTPNSHSTTKYINKYISAHHICCCIYVFNYLRASEASPQAFPKHFKASRESAVQIIDQLALCFGLGGIKFHSCLIASFASCSVASVLQFIQLQSVIYAFCVAIVELELLQSIKLREELIIMRTFVSIFGMRHIMVPVLVVSAICLFLGHVSELSELGKMFQIHDFANTFIYSNEFKLFNAYFVINLLILLKMTINNINFVPILLHSKK